MPDDKIQREIEDILSKLDDLPAERKPIPMRRRQRQAASFIDGLLAPLAAITVKHVMIVSLALIVIGFVTGRAYGAFGQWMLIAGVVLFIVGIIYSAMTRGGPAPGPKIEKRWRGQPMDLDSDTNPSFGDRFRSWFNRRR
jgi:hypothetical protein